MNWEDLGSNCIVFGAGVKGKLCHECISSHAVTIEYYVDNNENLWNTILDGIRILSPKALLSEPDGTTIIIASKYENDIRKQLEVMGISVRCKCFSFYDIELIDIKKAYQKLRDKFIDSEREDSDKPYILFDHQSFEMQNRGGISRYCKQVISRIVRDDRFKVDLFEGVNNNQENFNNEIAFCRRYWGDKLENIRFDSRQKSMMNVALLNDFTKSSTYNIYHPTYYRLYECVDYKKLVITVHDLTEERTGLFPGMPEIKKEIIEKADGIITVSESTKMDLQDIYNIPNDRIRVIYEANSLKNVTPTSRQVSEPYVLYVGDRKRYKNWNRFLQAFSICNYNEELKLVCFGGEELTSDEREQIDGLKLNQYVIHDAGADDVLASYYKYAEAFVYPSTYEGFGLPVLEAMYFGCPVIASNRTSLPEVGGSAAKYFDPYDIDSMVGALNGVLSSKELRKAMGIQGIEQEKKFSWDKAANETMDFYNYILGK